MRVPSFVVVAMALMACAAPRPVEGAPARASSGPHLHAPAHAYAVELVDEAGRVLPTFHQRGRTYVLGELGRRYLIRVRNGSPRPVEIVVSVDGRDVIDGRRASWEKRGYLVDAWEEVTIEGYRLSDEAVAAFRFSSVPDSYAARRGDARDVGVIGVAVFPGRYARERYRERYEQERRFDLPPAEATPGRSGEALDGEAAPAPDASRAPESRAPEGSRAEGSASAEPRHPDPGAQRRPGLGTEFGEQHASHVHAVAFERERARPDAVVALRYDDRRGLLALGIDLDGGRGDDVALRESAQPFRASPGFAEPPPGWIPR